MPKGGGLSPATFLVLILLFSGCLMNWIRGLTDWSSDRLVIIWIGSWPQKLCACMNFTCTDIPENYGMWNWGKDVKWGNIFFFNYSLGYKHTLSNQSCCIFHANWKLNLPKAISCVSSPDPLKASLTTQQASGSHCSTAIWVVTRGCCVPFSFTYLLMFMTACSCSWQYKLHVHLQSRWRSANIPQDFSLPDLLMANIDFTWIPPSRCTLTCHSPSG